MLNDSYKKKIVTYTYVLFESLLKNYNGICEGNNVIHNEDWQSINFVCIYPISKLSLNNNEKLNLLSHKIR